MCLKCGILEARPCTMQFSGHKNILIQYSYFSGNNSSPPPLQTFPGDSVAEVCKPVTNMCPINYQVCEMIFASYKKDVN